MSSVRPLYCFSHVQKAAGTSVDVVMRRHFGIGHMLVNPAIGWTYKPRDLAADLRLNPLTRSISSHWLRPFVDFGAWNERMIWYTFLRDPIARVLSHYQYHVERMGVTKSLQNWILDEEQNWQTRFLAGAPDLDAAKRILTTRYAMVGLTERFDESFVMLRALLGIDNLCLWYGHPRNVAASRERRERIHREFETFRDLVLELNQLDIELYAFALREIYPRQVAAFGGEQQLKSQTQEAKLEGRDRVASLREMSFLAYRRAFHLPVQHIRNGLARIRNEPDERY